MTLEELLDNCKTYRGAFEIVMENLKDADEEIEELSEKNKELLKRLIEKDLEAIKLAKQVRELLKELAQYRGEEAK